MPPRVTSSGTPYERGMMDVYYGRVNALTPHKMHDGKTITTLTPSEVKDYWSGVEEQFASGERKSWE